MNGKEIISSSRVVFENNENLDKKIERLEKEIAELKQMQASIKTEE